MKKILFVCTGNTCRSIMAEGIFNNIVANKHLEEQFEAISAGMLAFDGEHASINALKVLKAWNIDISYHSSKRITQEQIFAAHLILTMKKEQKNMLLAMYPSVTEVYTLKEYAQQSTEDVADPYGGDEQVYLKCALELKDAIQKVIERLCASDIGEKQNT